MLDHYIAGFPSLQNAIDAVPGWVGEMPPATGLVAGDAGLYADTRISWLLTDCYQAAGKSVLELGPLEAFHTFMLHQAGAREIDAIEANALAFFRCLITKEALKLDRASFFLGDFMKWLEESGRRYDLIVASGVLYHSHDPIRLLELICERTDSFYLWTHYFDDAAMPRGDLRRVPFSERVETKTCRGVDVQLYERSYYKAWEDPAFCGGIQDRHFWIDRGDILSLIKAFGFDTIKISDEQPEHINGPSFSVFAQRAPVVQPVEPTEEGVRPTSAPFELTTASPPPDVVDVPFVLPASEVEPPLPVQSSPDALSPVAPITPATEPLPPDTGETTAVPPSEDMTAAVTAQATPAAAPTVAPEIEPSLPVQPPPDTASPAEPVEPPIELPPPVSVETTVMRPSEAVTARSAVATVAKTPAAAPIGTPETELPPPADASAAALVPKTKADVSNPPDSNGEMEVEPTSRLVVHASTPDVDPPVPSPKAK